ncbi:MAG: sigma-54-dependent transcriptional regulator [Gammaproteobacteria bacterium]
MGLNAANVESVDVVVVEDSIPTSMLYQGFLESSNYSVKVFHDGFEAKEFLLKYPPKVLVQDVHLPGINGLEIVSAVVDAKLPTQVIVVTGEGSVDTAVEAMRCGSFDFIEKPFSRERLLVTVANAMRQKDLLSIVETYQDQIDIKSYHGFVGGSLPMQVVYRIIESAALSKASIFVTGESGTGKELCAEAIHKASDRKDGPFVALNCAAIPKELFESEIFGHVKGAFSGASSDRIGAAEQASGGTLFLDELCEMDIDLQAKLLRFIQTGSYQKVGSNSTKVVDVRFVCATNRDPKVEIANGRFREDLFYRLNVVPIQLPALHKRDTDVLHIASKLLLQFTKELNKQFSGLAPEVEEAFMQYPWPGNVRELRNVIENTVIMNTGTLVEMPMLPESFRTALLESKGAVKATGPAFKSPARNVSSALGTEIQPLWITEKDAIETAIAQCDGNVPVAAAHLGVSASTLYRKIKNWEAS